MDILGMPHRVIVSVQAESIEPFGNFVCLLAMAQSVVNGGAHGLRLANPENIRHIKQHLPDMPVIGITKPTVLPDDPAGHVYITPTLKDAMAVIDAGADIVAMDATDRPRPHNQTLAQVVAAIRQQAPDVPLMADVAMLKEGQHAADLGFDLMGTTLSGYTTETLERAKTGEPDFELLCALVQCVSVPVILEGRIWEPTHVRRAFDHGAHAVVIGSAITRPQLITQRFVGAAAHAS
jgi:N-acylglucosamine-6-phosphate 2-epimerase